MNNEGLRKRQLAVQERMQKLKLRREMHGRVDVGIYKVSNTASNLWRRFEQESASLWQVCFLKFVIHCDT